MSTIGDLFKAVREVIVLTERIEAAATVAREANQRSHENRERIIRLETQMEMMGRGAPSRPLLPPTARGE